MSVVLKIEDFKETAREAEVIFADKPYNTQFLSKEIQMKATRDYDISACKTILIIRGKLVTNKTPDGSVKQAIKTITYHLPDRLLKTQSTYQSASSQMILSRHIAKGEARILKALKPLIAGGIEFEYEPLPKKSNNSYTTPVKEATPLTSENLENTINTLSKWRDKNRLSKVPKDSDFHSYYMGDYASDADEALGN